MIIREYKLEDREGIEKCIFELQELELNLDSEVRQNSPEITHSYFDYLVKNLEKKDGKIFVAEDEGVIIGFMAVILEEGSAPYTKIKHYAYITDIAVLTQYRNQGIGKLLLAEAERFAIKVGLDMLYLDVMAKNNLALDFYHKNGFRDENIGLFKKING